MKKILFTLLLVAISTAMIGNSFVMIPYSGRTELEKLFSTPDLIVHHYTDSEVFATIKQFDDQSMVMIDEEAFSQNDHYTLVYCPNEEQSEYLSKYKPNALLQSKNYVLIKGPAMPFKNDGTVVIFNKAARLPKLTRDFPVVTEENPVIREMMNQVNMDSLEATVQFMQDYGNRKWDSDNAFACSDWIAGRMEAMGLEVEQQAFYANTWMGSGNAAPNVIGIQRGTKYPDTYVVCGSHFDSFSYYGNCPGADDNASGVASVLESARILTKYEFEYSIIYCAFGCEEMGLIGSGVYASRCAEEDMDIIGYFNNDMNGYLYGDQIHIDCIYPNSVEPIGTYYMNVGNIYYPETPICHVNFTQGDSDHTSFNDNGYMGIYPFEDYQNYSPYIHTPNDLIGNSVNSFAMTQRYCQMNIGCLTEIANPVDMPHFSCNPVTNFIIFEPTGENLSSVLLSWGAPEEGSTGDLIRFDIYRDGVAHATVDNDIYEFIDTISVGAQAEYFIMAAYSDGCEAASDTLIGVGITALDESMDHKISIYPNPVENLLTIEASDLQHVIIYNQMGQLVGILETEGANHPITVSMKAYPAGVYTLQLTTENGIYHRKILLE